MYQKDGIELPAFEIILGQICAGIGSERFAWDGYRAREWTIEAFGLLNLSMVFCRGLFRHGDWVKLGHSGSN